jgi:hypothetical protein
VVRGGATFIGGVGAKARKSVVAECAAVRFDSAVTPPRSGSILESFTPGARLRRDPGLRAGIPSGSSSCRVT